MTSGPFAASYIHARFVGGDCVARIFVMIADSSTTDGSSLTFELGYTLGTSSFMGATTPAVTFQSGAFSAPVGGNVEITRYTTPDGSDATTAGVAGTFSVMTYGIDLSGSFDTPFCQTQFCI